MEKYGTVPKRFTKEWWDYFWEYYKWHVIVSAFVAGMILVTVIQMATRVRYDVSATYVGQASYSDGTTDKIGAALSEQVEDVNHNGKKDVMFQVLVTADPNAKMENPQYAMGIETKKTFELQTSETMIFLFDENQVKSIYESQLAEGLFENVDTWCTAKNAEQRATGAAADYFVKIPSNAFSEKNGFMTGNIYIGVRKLRADEGKQDKQAVQQAAFKLANFILSTH